MIDIVLRARPSLDASFSVDLLRTNEFAYPAKPEQILAWLRTTDDEFHKKFLLFYILCEDIDFSENSGLDVNAQLMPEELCESFIKTFSLVYFSFLTRTMSHCTIDESRHRSLYRLDSARQAD